MNKLDALEAVVRRVRLSMEADIVAGALTATEIIRDSGLVPDWMPGNYAVGDVRNHNEQTWRCCQAHDSTVTTDWEPGAVASLWAPYHSDDPRYARPYVAPTGAHDAYHEGEYMTLDGMTYKCLADGTVHDPTAYPAAWESVNE